MIIKGLQGQSFFDVAIQYTGLAQNAAAIALANNKLASDEADGDLIIPDDLSINYKVLDSFTKSITKPASYEEF